MTAEQDPRDYPWPAADLILAEIKDRLAAQTAQKNALDTKAGLVVTGGAVFLAAVLQALLFPAKTVPGIVNVLALIAVLALAMAIGLGLWAYWLIRMERPPEPRVLREEYLARTESHTRLDLIDSYIEAFEQNEAKLEFRSVILRFAFAVLRLALGLLVMVVVINLLLTLFTS